jgi:hypothetical protein
VKENDRYEEIAVQFAALTEQIRNTSDHRERIELLGQMGFLIEQAHKPIQADRDKILKAAAD